MRIGVIYYSVTGTTEEFARRIYNGLIKEKHQVELIKIKTDKPITVPRQDFKITNELDFAGFDLVLFGGPVWAFSACPVIMEAIKKSKNLSDKKVVPFVTMGFPLKFLGGTQAIRKITRAVAEMGGDVLPGIIIPKLFHDFKALMDKSVRELISSIETP